MDSFWIYIVTFFASLLTLLTGFGLGTILTPVFALFYDVKLAVLLVAIVHFLNNVLKFLLFRKDVDLSIIKRFGIISIAGAFIGSFLQISFQSEVVKIILGVVLIILGASEFAPQNWSVRLPQKVDTIGGFLSGLLGGFVGNQGAVRSAYLLNYNISKETFIATATVIALCIDSTRIPVYLASNHDLKGQFQWKFLVVILLAFLGTMVGKKTLAKVSHTVFKKVVALFVTVMGVLFALKIL